MAAADSSETISGWGHFAELFDKYGVTFMITVCVVVVLIFVAKVLLKHFAAKLELNRTHTARINQLEIERRELDNKRLRDDLESSSNNQQLQPVGQNSGSRYERVNTPATDNLPVVPFDFSDHPFFHEANNVIALADHIWLGDGAKSLVARDIVIVNCKTLVSGLSTLVERIEHRGGFEQFFSSSADFASKIDRFYVWLRESTERRLKEENGMPGLILVKYGRATERHISTMRKMFSHAASTDNLPMEMRFWFIMNSFLAAVLNVIDKVSGIIKELNGELNGIEYKGVLFGGDHDRSKIDEIVAEEHRSGSATGSGLRRAIRDESGDIQVSPVSEEDIAAADEQGSDNFFFMETLEEIRDEDRPYPTIDDFDRILGTDPGSQPTRTQRRNP